MTLLQKQKINNVPLFCLLWLLLFALYIPTMKAGFVADFTGWLAQLKYLSFPQYLNRHDSQITSLYQFTQFITYVFYKLFGLNAWLWLLLHITLQAINSLLLFVIARNIFDNAGIKNGNTIALGAVFLFCICPHISETVVWKPSYHYLQGFLFILLILYWLQKFQHQQEAKYAWWAAIVFFLSTYSLEVFYLTPWFALSLALYYRLALRYDKSVFKKTCLYFFVPQLALFLVHLIVFRAVYGTWIPHITATLHKDAAFYLGKPLKYIFHILFFGRFFPHNIKTAVYDFCDSPTGMIVFYTAFIICCIAIALRLNKMTAKGKIAVLFFIWALIAISIIIPLGFPPLLLVYGDRYTYLLDAFTYLLLSLLLSDITVKYLAAAIWAVYALINSYFTIEVNIYWKHSAYVLSRMLNTFPNAGNKAVILLDVPDNMNGIPMIHTAPESEYKLLHNLVMPEPINNTVYDGVSFNMLTKGDGVHVQVLNDSMIKVTLNQWGTWWWNNGIGAVSYENADYKVNITDPGHVYELTIKKPAAGYMLLYQTGGIWKQVDWNTRAAEQY
ncbi:MAG: hypothetical protein JSS96_15745 [Bacteroidetes bacterium]|nr:hypothetical protein [Bacteroidota bacterium]